MVRRFAGTTAYEYFVKSISFAEAANIFLQVSQTRGMNKEGFAHKDIKYNICISTKNSGPSATVIDVGMSMPVDGQGFYATPNYAESFLWIAPDLLMNTGPCEASTDVYGFAHFMHTVLRLD